MATNFKAATYANSMGGSQTADCGSFNGTFQQGWPFGQQTVDLGTFDGTLQQNSNYSQQTANIDLVGRQFVREHKTTKVCNFFTNQLTVMESARRTAKVR